MGKSEREREKVSEQAGGRELKIFHWTILNEIGRGHCVVWILASNIYRSIEPIDFKQINQKKQPFPIHADTLFLCLLAIILFIYEVINCFFFRVNFPVEIEFEMAQIRVEIEKSLHHRWDQRFNYCESKASKSCKSIGK